MKMTPEQVWKEYDKTVTYKSAIELYDQCKTNQDFYNGNQWEGVNAPNIDKPVINILRSAVDYYVSNIVSDDIAVRCDLDDIEDETTKKALEYATSQGINKVFEQSKFKENTRNFIKDCAVNGDAYFHWWYDTTINLDSIHKGAINLELIDTVNIGFGDPAEQDEQKQPYILVVQKLPVDKVKKMVGKEQAELIKADSEDHTNTDADAKAVQDYTTVIVKLWKENNTVWVCKTTEKVMLDEPKDLGIRLYPIAKMSWRRVRNSYHGISPLTECIPNQIMINKYFMMLNEFVKKMSFPKILYDGNVIQNWSNKVEAIKTNGPPGQAVAITTPQVSLSSQFVQFANELIQKTKETLGVYDTALGNISNPDNMGAIIAVQKSAAQPLELQRLDYLQVVENSVRIIIDLMSTHYGKRDIPIIVDGQRSTIEFDFKDLDYNEFGMNVEVGQAAYWSEITQIQTLDNMFQKGIIPDAVTYINALPDGIVPKKQDILMAIAAKQKFLDAQAMAMQQPQQPPQGLPLQ